MRKMMLLLTIAVTCMAGSASATDYTFNVASGDWSVGTNWIPNGTPQDGDSATIPGGKTCYIDTNEECDKIAVTGTLEIEEGFSLTLRPEAGEGSTVTGLLTLAGDANTADLIIDGEVEILGDFGQLQMVNGLIKPLTDGDDELTLTWVYELATPLWLHGYGEISVALDSSVWVQADESQKTLKLSGYDKVASGPVAEWEATDGGTLEVDCTVTGSAPWQQISGGGYTKILIKECLSVSGDVTIITGTFEAQASFCTTGDLIWTGNTGIDVGSGATATFGESCSAFCP